MQQAEPDHPPNKPVKSEIVKLNEAIETLRQFPYFTNAYDRFEHQRMDLVQDANAFIQRAMTREQETLVLPTQVLKLMYRELKHDARIVSPILLQAILLHDPKACNEGKKVPATAKETYTKVFWQLVKTVYAKYFGSLFNLQQLNVADSKKGPRELEELFGGRLCSIYDFAQVFEDREGNVKLVTETGNRKRLAQDMNPILRMKLACALDYGSLVSSSISDIILGKGQSVPMTLFQFYLNVIYLPQDSQKYNVFDQLILTEKNLDKWLQAYDSRYQPQFTDRCLIRMLEHIEEKKRSMKAYAEGLLTVLKKGKITFRQLQLISVPAELADVEKPLQLIVLQSGSEKAEFVETLKHFLQLCLTPLDEEDNQRLAIKETQLVVDRYLESSKFTTAMKAIRCPNLKIKDVHVLYSYFTYLFNSRQYTSAVACLELVLTLDQHYQFDLLSSFPAFFQQRLEEIFYIFGHVRSLQSKQDSYYYEQIFKVSEMQIHQIKSHFVPVLRSFLYGLNLRMKNVLLGDGDGAFLHNPDQLFQVFVNLFETYMNVPNAMRQVCYQILQQFEIFTSTKPLRRYIETLLHKNLHFLLLQFPFQDHFIGLLDGRLLKSEIVEQVWDLSQLRQSDMVNQMQLQMAQDSQLSDWHRSKQILNFEILLQYFEKQCADTPILYYRKAWSLYEYALAQPRLTTPSLDSIKFLVYRTIIHYHLRQQCRPVDFLQLVTYLTLKEEFAPLRFYLINTILPRIAELGINVIPVLTLMLCDKNSFIRKRIKRVQSETQEYFTRIEAEETSQVCCFNFLVYLIENIGLNASDQSNAALIMYLIKKFTMFVVPAGKKVAKKRIDACLLQLQVICQNLILFSPLPVYVQFNKQLQLPKEKEAKLLEKYAHLKVNSQPVSSRQRLFEFMQACIAALNKSPALQSQAPASNDCIDGALYQVSQSAINTAINSRMGSKQSKKLRL